jgi:RibD C-terminal domain
MEQLLSAQGRRCQGGREAQGIGRRRDSNPRKQRPPTLLRNNLIDSLRVWQFPVVIGTGKRLFGQGTIPGSFRLVDTQMTTTGAVLHVKE